VEAHRLDSYEINGLTIAPFYHRKLSFGRRFLFGDGKRLASGDPALLSIQLGLRVLVQFGLSFTPWLQPGDQQGSDLSSRFIGLPFAVSGKTVETVPHSKSGALTTGLKPRCE
jgi:hypothetical protein